MARRWLVDRETIVGIVDDDSIWQDVLAGPGGVGFTLRTA